MFARCPLRVHSGVRARSLLSLCGFLLLSGCAHQRTLLHNNPGCTSPLRGTFVDPQKPRQYLLIHLERQGPEPAPYLLELRPNKAFAYCFPPGTYAATEIEVFGIWHAARILSSATPLQFTLTDSTEHDLGTLTFAPAPEGTRWQAEVHHQPLLVRAPDPVYYDDEEPSVGEVFVEGVTEGIFMLFGVNTHQPEKGDVYLLQQIPAEPLDRAALPRRPLTLWQPSPPTPADEPFLCEVQVSPFFCIKPQ